MRTNSSDRPDLLAAPFARLSVKIAFSLAALSFTNNTAEQKIRMAKVKIKVSGCFRTERFAHAWCRISSYLDTMAELGYNPIEAIQIALDGNAADMIKQYDRAA